MKSASSVVRVVSGVGACIACLRTYFRLEWEAGLACNCMSDHTDYFR